MKKTIVFLIFGIQFFHFQSYAKISMPAIFSDNMVLQQQSKVLVWGKTDAHKPVVIAASWDKNVQTVDPDGDGKWKVAIETPKAGGPYDLKISDGDELVFKNILVGEVWLCSGQSNMDIPMAGVPNVVVIKDANPTIVHSHNDRLRLFTVGYSPNKKVNPNQNVWQLAAPNTVSKFSAVGYQFACQLQEVLNVPVGMIKCARSGTRIESWISEQLLQNEFKIAPLSPSPQANTSELFNEMILQIAGYGIKGVLWYQGEGNHRDAELYARQLPAMVKEWRNVWGLGDIPFYFAQIAPFNTKNNLSPYMRQTMADCMKVIPNSGVVILTDAGEENDIHPKDKKVVADRFLYWALAKTYEMSGFGYCGPIYKSLKIKGKEVTVSFDYTESGLTSFGKELLNFEIAGRDTVYMKASAKISKEGNVTVWNDEVSDPIAVRYAFKDFVVGDLFNGFGLPATTFQTLKKIKK